MIYLPDEINSAQCAYMYDKDTIRVYDSKPQINQDIDYTDYFINSHYLTRTGITRFGSYSTINYDCLPVDKFSMQFIYRNDLMEILAIALILIGCVWYLVSKMIRSFTRGFRRY